MKTIKERHKYKPEDLYYQNLSEKNDSWCPLPWAQVAVHNSGEYRSCIQARTCKKTKDLSVIRFLGKLQDSYFFVVF